MFGMLTCYLLVSITSEYAFAQKNSTNSTTLVKIENFTNNQTLSDNLTLNSIPKLQPANLSQNKSNMTLNFIPKDEMDHLSDILTGYMTIISILIATAVFFVTMLQQFTTPDTKKKYQTLTYSLLVASVILVGYGISLIIITGQFQLDFIAFFALIIPIYAIWSVSRRKK